MDKENEEKITKEVVTINDKQVVNYYYGTGDYKKQKKYNTLKELLSYNFLNQGDFYKKVFGVNFEDAEEAYWDPNSTCFNSKSSGWLKFNSDNGKFKKDIKVETNTLKEFIMKEFKK